jgi:hypothetical protein
MAVAHGATARKEMLTKKSHRFQHKTPQSSGATISSIPTTTFSDSGLSSWCRFLIYQKKKTLEPTVPETHQNANLSNSFEVLSILKTSKPHKTILRKTSWFKIMTIPTETFAYQFSAFARPVYCFVLLFWTLDCARSNRRFNDITKHRKSSSNHSQNEI